MIAADEAKGEPPSSYYDLEHVAGHVRKGQHREVIGGLWEQVGRLQLDFLVKHGLKRGHRLIDIGCGSLRGGVRFVAYLEPDRYYGIDLSQDLLDAGWEHEIVPLSLDKKLPRENLKVSDSFDLSPFCVQFDMGIAQSVFSHLPLSYLAECLARTAPFFVPGAKFFVTCFLVPDRSFGGSYKQGRGGVVTFPDKDPFHYTAAQLSQALGADPGWDLKIIGDWAHPRQQQMLMFTRRR